jgi:hypothetical protein
MQKHYKLNSMNISLFFSGLNITQTQSALGSATVATVRMSLLILMSFLSRMCLMIFVFTQ